MIKLARTLALATIAFVTIAAPGECRLRLRSCEGKDSGPVRVSQAERLTQAFSQSVNEVADQIKTPAGDLITWSIGGAQSGGGDGADSRLSLRGCVNKSKKPTCLDRVVDVSSMKFNAARSERGSTYLVDLSVPSSDGAEVPLTPANKSQSGGNKTRNEEEYLKCWDAFSAREVPLSLIQFVLDNLNSDVWTNQNRPNEERRVIAAAAAEAAAVRQNESNAKAAARIAEIQAGAFKAAPGLPNSVSLGVQAIQYISRGGGGEAMIPVAYTGGVNLAAGPQGNIVNNTMRLAQAEVVSRVASPTGSEIIHANGTLGQLPILPDVAIHVTQPGEILTIEDARVALSQAWSFLGFESMRRNRFDRVARNEKVVPRGSPEHCEAVKYVWESLRRERILEKGRDFEPEAKTEEFQAMVEGSRAHCNGFPTKIPRSVSLQ